MRIISQNGEWNIPTEKAFLRIVFRDFPEPRYEIRAYSQIDTADRSIVLARYSSKEKAEEEMEYATITIEQSYQFPEEEIGNDNQL